MLSIKRHNTSSHRVLFYGPAVFCFSICMQVMSCLTGSEFSIKDRDQKGIDEYTKEIEKNPSEHGLYLKRAIVYWRNCSHYKYDATDAKALNGCVADIERAISLAGTKAPSEYHYFKAYCVVGSTFSHPDWPNQDEVPKYMESDRADLKPAEAALDKAIETAENGSLGLFYRTNRMALNFHLKDYKEVIKDYDFIRRNVEKFGWAGDFAPNRSFNADPVLVNSRGHKVYEELYRREKDLKKKAILKKATSRAYKTWEAYYYLKRYGIAGKEDHFKRIHEIYVLPDTQEDLFEAATDNNIQGIAKALSEGARIDLPDAFNNYKTALHYAAEEKNHAAMKALLNAGANPDVTNNSRQPPLARAVALGDAEGVRILLAKKAKHTLNDYSAIRYAKSPEIIQMLKAAGAKGEPEITATTGSATKTIAKNNMNKHWCVTIIMAKTESGMGAARTLYAARIFVVNDNSNANENQIRQFASAENSRKSSNGYRPVETIVTAGDNFEAAKSVARKKYYIVDFTVDHVVKK